MYHAEIDVNCLAIARKLRKSIPDNGAAWTAVMSPARRITMDAMDLDDVPALALALKRSLALTEALGGWIDTRAA
jgi:hypothetical protein